MIEIAICLAIVSFALIAIIGVLPLGLNTQKDNREETIINQDATVLIEAIRNGARGSDYLTNYVYYITNTSQIGSQWSWSSSSLTNGASIIGVLSGYPAGDHYVAYIHSISGLAAEKPPQDNTLMTDGAFSYRVVCVNVPVQLQNNVGVNKELAANLHELRMTFMWPLYPNGNVGSGRKTFRATIAGQLSQDASGLYFYHPQAFTNAP